MTAYPTVSPLDVWGQQLKDWLDENLREEIAYAEIISTVSTTSTGGVLIPDTTKVVPVGPRPYKVHWDGLVYCDTAGQASWVDLYEDGVKIKRTGGTSATASAVVPFSKTTRRPVPTVQHTYELYLVANAAGINTHLLAGTAGSSLDFLIEPM